MRKKGAADGEMRKCALFGETLELLVEKRGLTCCVEFWGGFDRVQGAFLHFDAHGMVMEEDAGGDEITHAWGLQEPG